MYSLYMPANLTLEPQNPAEVGHSNTLVVPGLQVEQVGKKKFQGLADDPSLTKMVNSRFCERRCLPKGK